MQFSTVFSSACYHVTRIIIYEISTETTVYLIHDCVAHIYIFLVLKVIILFFILLLIIFIINTAKFTLNCNLIESVKHFQN